LNQIVYKQDNKKDDETKLNKDNWINVEDSNLDNNTKYEK